MIHLQPTDATATRPNSFAEKSTLQRIVSADYLRKCSMMLIELRHTTDADPQLIANIL